MGSIVFDKRLIDAVRAEQCLYDSTTRDYRDMEERNAAWIRVASIIGAVENASYCKKRFRIIRDRYVKRKRLNAQNGPKAFWDCEDMLSFLDGKITARSAKSSSRKRSNALSLETKFKFKKEEDDEPDLPETYNNNLSEYGEEDYLLEPLVEETGQQEMKTYHDPLLHFAHTTAETDNINNETVDFNSSSKEIVVHQTMDEIDYFSAMMATKLRKLTDKKCSEAKLNIMKILHDIEFENS